MTQTIPTQNADEAFRRLVAENTAALGCGATAAAMHKFSGPLARDLFALGVENMLEARRAAEREEAEREELRAEDRAANTPDRFAAMDRRDRSGPHYFFRS